MNGNVNLVEEQRMHRAEAVRNTNSKNIFREPLLYAQFRETDGDTVVSHIADGA